MNKTTVVILSVLCGALGVLLLFKPDTYQELEDTKSAGLDSFKEIDFGKISRVTLVKGRRDAVEIDKQGDGWVVASAWGYEADTEIVDKMIATLSKIDDGEVTGETGKSHQRLGVDKNLGSFLTLRDSGGAELGRLVVGNTARTANFSVSFTCVLARKTSPTR